MKSLLEQSTIDNVDNVVELPKVLFIGDAYTRSKSSYANQLIKNKVVDGRVVAWPGINIKNLVKLLKRYNKPEYSVVSVMFGDIIIGRKIGNIELPEFESQLKDLETAAKLHGAQLVLIENPTNQYIKYLDYLDAILDDSKFSPDSIISVVNQLNSSSTQSKIANAWIKSVNLDLNIDVTDVDVKTLEKSVEADSDSEIQSNKISQPSNNIQANFSDSIVNQSFDVILPFEGFTPVAIIDSDKYCRIGHGSSWITKKDGSVIMLGKPKSGKSCGETYPQYVITPEDADRDLRRLISDLFLPEVSRQVKAWGGDISKLNDSTVAVLVSVAYNYGHIPNELKDGIRANDAAAIGNALSTQFNSAGSNPKRRKQEGAYILSSLDKSNDTKSTKLGDIIKNNNILGAGKIHTGPIGINSPYGMRSGGMHYGIDFRLGVGTPIYMAMAGKITRADGTNVTGYGDVIYVEHEDGTVTRYGHMSRTDVRKDDVVAVGDLIGLTGGEEGARGAGNSTGPHLHWEYRPGGSIAKNGVSVYEKYFATKPIEQKTSEIPALPA